MSRRRVRASLASLAWLILAASAAHATPENDLDPENLISDSLPAHAAADASAGRRLPFAILPQVGYGPATGPMAGVKFEGRDLFGGATVGDVNLLIAWKRQQKATVNVGNTELGPFMLFGTWAWYSDPAVEFFGIGNNEIGPDPLSNHSMRRLRVGLTVGYRILPRFAVVLSAFYRDTNIANGSDDDTPSTQRFAPGLPGVHGAPSNYLSAALVYNSRDDLVRPTEGWKVIVKYLSADHTMRGYFPQRFLGKGSALVNVEYRLKLIDFNFRKLWDVSIDGVGFGDVGRVYEDSSDFLHHTLDHMRYSYGGGLRIGLSSGLVARIDAGFSPEEKGLVYLTFGHTF